MQTALFNALCWVLKDRIEKLEEKLKKEISK